MGTRQNCPKSWPEAKANLLFGLGFAFIVLALDALFMTWLNWHSILFLGISFSVITILIGIAMVVQGVKVKNQATEERNRLIKELRKTDKLHIFDTSHINKMGTAEIRLKIAKLKKKNAPNNDRSQVPEHIEVDNSATAISDIQINTHITCRCPKCGNEYSQDTKVSICPFCGETLG